MSISDRFHPFTIRTEIYFGNWRKIPAYAFSVSPAPPEVFRFTHIKWLDPQLKSIWTAQVECLKFKSLLHLHTNLLTPSFKSLPFISRSPHLKHKLPSSSDFEATRISHCPFNVPPHLQKECLFTRAQCDSLEFARQVRKSPEAEEEY